MKNIKRFFALLLVVVFVAVVIITLLAAIFCSPDSNFFKGMISLMIVLPVIAYGYSLLYKFWLSIKKDNKQAYEEYKNSLESSNIKKYAKPGDK